MHGHILFWTLTRDLNFADASKSLAIVLTVLHAVLINIVYDTGSLWFKIFCWHYEMEYCTLERAEKRFSPLRSLHAPIW